MQNAVGGRRLGDSDQLSQLVDQAYWSRRMDRARRHLAGTDVPTVEGPEQPFVGEHDGAELGKHVVERQERLEGVFATALRKLQRNRVIERQGTTGRTAERGKMRAGPEPPPEVVRQRADIESGG